MASGAAAARVRPCPYPDAATDSGSLGHTEEYIHSSVWCCWYRRQRAGVACYDCTSRHHIEDPPTPLVRVHQQAYTYFLFVHRTPESAPDERAPAPGAAQRVRLAALRSLAATAKSADGGPVLQAGRLVSSLSICH